jgi:hypothetical protein
MYTQAHDQTKLAEDTLRQERYVSENVQFGDRSPNLSWYHHYIVAEHVQF